MGNFIAIHLLKNYNPGTFNRGENGEAKQIIVGGVNRVRFSSQCQKRAIRELMACDEIRTAHIERLIEKCLDVKVADGTLTEAEKDTIGKLICSKAVIGTDCWAKLKTKDKVETEKERQGNVVVTTNASEIDALINTFITYLKEHGAKDLEKNYKKVAETVALNDVHLSVAKSLFGTMATDGVLGTVDGALQMGQAYSVDAYLPETDIFTVKFTGRSGVDESDPFFGAYSAFNAAEGRKAASETFNTGLPLYSNLIYSYANINLKELKKNLNTFVGTKEYFENPETETLILDTVNQFVQAMIKMTPEATQNRSASYVEPVAVLIEVIENDTNLQPDWTKVISNNGREISEQAIERLSNFANNKTFRSGNIRQYVMFGSEFGKFAENFTDATQLNNFKELTDALNSDIQPLI